ncbi:hypothetical protein [Cohnella luojiensis]|uniref:hypothetical protein n=1 Tax=Cohnella luojiensis TaxID=652876 RepID=UPI0014315692|nr:hypothetical protein [Cohnella luojiensis]
MDIPYCCGAEMKVISRSDHPPIYDDAYDLQIPVFVCTNCGKTIVLHDENKEP